MEVRVPIDFKDVAEKTGMKKGTLCHVKLFGWGVFFEDGDLREFAEYKPPVEHNGLPVIDAKIENGEWVLTI